MRIRCVNFLLCRREEMGGVGVLKTCKRRCKLGEMIYGNVIITNLGTASDTMRINTVEMDCNLDDTEVVLSPSMSSSPIPWSCMIAEGETSGTKVLT